MEEKINKILTRTERIDQIKTDLKKLKDLAETTREDHGILLDIQAKLDTYRSDSIKLTNEVKKNTDEIQSLKGNITKLEEENSDLKMKLMEQQPNIEGEVNKRVHRSEQRKQLIIEGVPENTTEIVILTAKQICVDTGVHVLIPDLDNTGHSTIRAKMLVNDCEVNFEIDSGAKVNIIQQKYVLKSQVKPATLSLTMWNHSSVKPLGGASLNVTNPKTGKLSKLTLSSSRTSSIIFSELLPCNIWT